LLDRSRPRVTASSGTDEAVKAGIILITRGNYFIVMWPFFAELKLVRGHLGESRLRRW
jgi:hypothetical protein